jgi:hypothetical protein
MARIAPHVCAVLVTSSMVAVRGLARSLYSDFGFEPRNAMLMETSLEMAGYRGGEVSTMQRRMIDAMEKTSGVTAVGLVDLMPLFGSYANGSPVFTDETTDLRPSNAVVRPVMYRIISRIFSCGGPSLAVWKGLHVA